MLYYTDHVIYQMNTYTNIKWMHMFFYLDWLIFDTIFFFWLWTEAPFVVSFFSRLCWWFELACCLHAWAGFEVSAFTCSKLIIENNARTMCETCSNLTIKIPERRLVIKIRERRHWRCSGVFIVNFEHISHLVLVFLLLTLNM